MSADHKNRGQPLSALFARNDLVLVPAELTNVESLPMVTLGPHLGIDLDEFLSMVSGMGARGIYLANPDAHFEAVTNNRTSPQPLVVRCVVNGVLHVWTSELAG